MKAIIKVITDKRTTKGGVYLGSTTRYQTKVNGATVKVDGKNLREIKKNLTAIYGATEFDVVKSINVLAY